MTNGITNAGIGHNNPPSPFDEAREAIDAIFEEASHWLDGAVVKTQDEATAIAKLLDMARQAKKQADDARKVEAKPFDDGKKEVQSRYKPLLDRADRVADACKKALTPFEIEQQRKRDDEARKAREEADRLQREAEEAIRAAKGIEEKEAAEAAIALAKAKDTDANKKAKEGTATKGARAISLRTVYHATVTDPNAFAKYVWAHRRRDILSWLEDFAQKQVVASNGNISLPGVTITEEKVAV